MEVITMTGSVGTGKTTIAKKLCDKLDFEYIDVNKIIKKHKIAGSYDKRRKCKVVDVKKLNKALISEISKFKKNKKGIIIDSHLSHYLPKKYVDLCIVTKCNLKTLKKRLEKRRYNKNKIRENLDAEIFDTCNVESSEKGHNIKIVYTDKKINYENLINTIRKIK